MAGCVPKNVVHKRIEGFTYLWKNSNILSVRMFTWPAKLRLLVAFWPRPIKQWATKLAVSHILFGRCHMMAHYHVPALWQLKMLPSRPRLHMCNLVNPVLVGRWPRRCNGSRKWRRCRRGWNRWFSVFAFRNRCCRCFFIRCFRVFDLRKGCCRGFIRWREPPFNKSYIMRNFNWDKGNPYSLAFVIFVALSLVLFLQLMALKW